VDNGRVQFIKQDRPKNKTGVTFFLALTCQVEPRLYQFELNDYYDLLQLDIPALLSGASIYDEFLRTESLSLVCTNGKRDRCCTLTGMTLYQAMAERVGSAVWQSTHLGGHRFAPTLVTFPDGTFYGRLATSDVNSFVRAQERGEFYLSHLRGRCCYAEVAQAAEQFLYQKTGSLHRSSYRLLQTQPLEGTLWSVDFNGPVSGEIYRLIVSQELSSDERMVSCSPPKSKPVLQFRLVSYERIKESLT
jgi:(2Fe-2S) ferredoxin